MDKSPQLINVLKLLQLREDIGEDAYHTTLQLFKEESFERLDKIWNAFEAYNHGVIKQEAHALKSTSALLGAEQLFQLVVQIEQYKNVSIPKLLLDKLSFIHEATCAELEKIVFH